MDPAPAIAHPSRPRRALLLVAAIIATLGTMNADDAGLSGYVNKDLRKLEAPQQEALRKTFRELTKDQPVEVMERDPFELWFVKPFHSGDARWMFLEAYPGYEVPDVSGVRVHLFDQAWKKILTTTFPTGYRFFLKDALLEEGKSIGAPLLMVQVTSSGPFMELPDGTRKPAFEAGDFQKLYYAFTGGRLALVRLEDHEAKIVSNNYASREPWKGPEVPQRSVDAWIDTLVTGPVAEKLATLVWLSGDHLESSEKRQENVNQQSVEDSKRYEEVRASPRTKEALEKLARDENAWLRDYAKFTLKTLAAKEGEDDGDEEE